MSGDVYITWMLAQVKLSGSKWDPLGCLEEGPRRRGHCAYCCGPCFGSRQECEIRVFREGRGI